MFKVSNTTYFTFWIYIFIPFNISNAFLVNDPDEYTPGSITMAEIGELSSPSSSLFADNESLTLGQGAGLQRYPHPNLV